MEQVGPPMAMIERVTLETSLKPFKSTDDAALAATCREIFRQWQALTATAQRVAVMLWVGDGSEILEWKGDLEEEIPWASSIGFCNVQHGAFRQGWEARNPERPYMPDPPRFTYRHLQGIVALFKRIGAEEFGLSVEVGATIDPGPEFVESQFKYVRHPEIITGGERWQPGPPITFIRAYGTLRADDVAYAGLPDGVPEGTSFGAFLGRQCSSFLPAMGFDYLWLSNGLGFSHYAWTLTGENFDGERFGCTDYAAEAERVVSFWRDFRRECPDCPIEVRGTNFPMGVDIAADCICFERIYELGRPAAQPVNPPWGSRDLGMEMTAHMSRIAVLPGEQLGIRHYVNDPWFCQNPWWDFYNREPYDYYCPWVVGALRGDGSLQTPTWLELLTVDTEEGALNEDTAIEIVPHLRRAMSTVPDAPGLLTWVYPFHEYHALAREEPACIGLTLFNDLFIRAAIQNGLPLNTVLASHDFVSLVSERPEVLRHTVIVAPVPREEWPYGDPLADWIAAGGRALLYGSVASASKRIRGVLNLEAEVPIENEVDVELSSADWDDELTVCDTPHIAYHNSQLSGGPMVEALRDEDDDATAVRAFCRDGHKRRVGALHRAKPEWNGGAVAWVRGSLAELPAPGSFARRDDAAPGPLDVSLWLRLLLADFGIHLRQVRHSAGSQPIALFVSRHRNGFLFTGFKPDATAALRMRFPQGVPLLTERETRIEDGLGRYYLARSFQEECRVFVDQREPTLLRCKADRWPTGKERSLMVSGLRDAKLTVYPYAEALEGDRVEFEGHTELEPRVDVAGKCIELAGVSGQISVTW